ncbi:hypothetical protein GW758_02635 [Candidatus Falkowbacteria bacterium]|nr:hypothetical protein [Candidatus Falkowbacteria bacterium]NCT54825.1 hypothetical protein [Candidatus Falkowbacteria bacterium]
MKITICGSIAFYQEMEELKESLSSRGHEVYIPLLNNEAPAEMGGGKKIYFGKYIEDNGGIDSFLPDHQIWDLKEKAIRDHYEKIEWADAIVVANYEKRGLSGYVGGNTLIEIGLAFYLNKKIFILNPVSSDISYKQEIMGMKPVMLNGDLSLIN